MTRRRGRRLGAFVLLPCVMAAGCSLTDGRRSNPTALPPGSVNFGFESSEVLSNAAGRGPAPASTTLDVIFGLARRAGDLDAVVRSTSDPASPEYQRFKSARWIDQHFGATGAVRANVVAALAAVGTKASADPTGSYVEAKMSAAEVDRLFQVNLTTFRFPDGLTAVGPDRMPTLPVRMTNSVDLVLGLTAITADPRPVPSYPRVRPTTPPPVLGGTPAGCPQAKATGGLVPNELSTAYGLVGLHQRGIEGQGISLAVSETTPVSASDLAEYARCFSLPSPHLATYDTGLPSPALSPTQSAAVTAEAALDAEVVEAVAPRLTSLDVLVGRDNNGFETWIEHLSAVVDPHLISPPPAVLSISFGECEPDAGQSPESVELIRYLTEVDAVAGVTVVASAGDRGSTDCRPGEDGAAQLSTEFPASSSAVTAVGGTQLMLNRDNTIAREDAWNELPYYGVRAGGGGGESELWDRPWYQSNLGLPCCGRMVPDVSFDALARPGYLVFCAGCSGARAGWSDANGGTSASAPLFGAGVALADQALHHAGHPPAGLINPALYDLYGHDPAVFDKIDGGSNDVLGVQCCDVTSGYNTATGLGSINFTALVTALLRPH